MRVLIPIIVGISLLSGCTSKEGSQKTQTIPTFQISAPAEVLPWLSRELRLYLESAQKSQASNNPLTLRTISLSDYQAAQDLPRGTIKAHLWVAASERLVETANKHVVNLGAHYVDCRPLFSTPIITATSPSADASPADVAAKNSAEGRGATLYFTGDPESHPAQLASIDSTHKKIPTSGIRFYKNLGGALKTISALSPPLNAEIDLTEQQFIAHAQAGKLLYPTPSAESDRLHYVVCVAQAEWVDQTAALVAQKLGAWLSAPESKARSEELGFRDFEVDPTHPQTENFSEAALSAASDYRKKRALSDVALLIDTSASMTGPKVEAAKNVVARILAGRADGNRFRSLRIWTFGAKTRFIGDDPALIQRLLQTTITAGGSVLYDALLAAAEQQAGIAPSRRVVVAVIDGPDKGSTTRLQEFKARFTTLVQKYDVELYVVAIEEVEGELAETAEIIRSVGGRFSGVSAAGLIGAVDEMAAEVM